MLKQTHPGERQDLQHYKGYPIVGYEFQYFNTDDSEYDFTGIQNAVFKILQKQFGTLINQFSKTDGEIVCSGNSLIISVAKEELDFRPKEYWYESYWINSDGDEILLNFGVYDFSSPVSTQPTIMQAQSGSNAKWGGLWNFSANGGGFPNPPNEGTVYIAEDNHGTIGDADFVQEGSWMISNKDNASVFADFEYNNQ